MSVTVIPRHSHSYAQVAAEVNRDAWEFMKANRYEDGVLDLVSALLAALVQPALAANDDLAARIAACTLRAG